MNFTVTDSAGNATTIAGTDSVTITAASEEAAPAPDANTPDSVPLAPVEGSPSFAGAPRAETAVQVPTTESVPAAQVPGAVSGDAPGGDTVQGGEPTADVPPSGPVPTGPQAPAGAPGDGFEGGGSLATPGGAQIDAQGPQGSDEAAGQVESTTPVVVLPSVEADDATRPVIEPGGPAGRFTLVVFKGDGSVDTRTVEAPDLATAVEGEFSDGAESVTVTRVEAVPGTDAPAV
jgi:hypothetical protein